MRQAAFVRETSYRDRLMQHDSANGMPDMRGHLRVCHAMKPIRVIEIYNIVFKHFENPLDPYRPYVSPHMLPCPGALNQLCDKHCVQLGILEAFLFATSC